MSSATHADPSFWSAHSSAGGYSPVERITAPLCAQLVEMTASLCPFVTTGTKPSWVLDNGAGTGMLTAVLKACQPDLKIHAIDISSGMLEQLSSMVHLNRWDDTISISIVDAQALDIFGNSSFTHVMSSFMIGSAEQPQKVASEMYRVTKPGGVLGLAVWADICWRPLWEKAMIYVMTEVRDQNGYEAPYLTNKDWNTEEDVRRGLEAVGWCVEECQKASASWGWQSADEVDQYIFEAGNPIVNLLMTGMPKDELQIVRAAFRRVVVEEYDHGKAISQLAILVTARKAY